jgi:hypothetical protein
LKTCSAKRGLSCDADCANAHPALTRMAVAIPAAANMRGLDVIGIFWPSRSKSVYQGPLRSQSKPCVQRPGRPRGSHRLSAPFQKSGHVFESNVGQRRALRRALGPPGAGGLLCSHWICGPISSNTCRDRKETSRICASESEAAPGISRSMTYCGIIHSTSTFGAVIAWPIQPQDQRSSRRRA